MVPEADFTSYHGRPVLKETVWGPAIPTYLFLGGLAGALRPRSPRARSCPGHPELASTAKVGRGRRPSASRWSRCVLRPRTAGPVRQHAASVQGDVADERRHLAAVRLHPPRLGRRRLRRHREAAAERDWPPPSPPACSGPAWPLTPRCWWPTPRRPPGTTPTASSPTCSSARPLPRPAGSACSRSRPTPPGPRLRLALLGAAAELTAERLLDRRLGPAAEPYRTGRSGALMRASQGLAAAGATAALVGRRNRAVSSLAGAALLAGSAVSRFAVFEAGRASVRDPKYTVGPQRERVGRGQPVAPVR